MDQEIYQAVSGCVYQLYGMGETVQRVVYYQEALLFTILLALLYYWIKKIHKKIRGVSK